MAFLASLQNLSSNPQTSATILKSTRVNTYHTPDIWRHTPVPFRLCLYENGDLLLRVVSFQCFRCWLSMQGDRGFSLYYTAALFSVMTCDLKHTCIFSLAIILNRHFLQTMFLCFKVLGSIYPNYIYINYMNMRQLKPIIAADDPSYYLKSKLVLVCTNIMPCVSFTQTVRHKLLLEASPPCNCNKADSCRKLGNPVKTLQRRTLPLCQHYFSLSLRYTQLICFFCPQWFGNWLKHFITVCFRSSVYF